MSATIQSRPAVPHIPTSCSQCTAAIEFPVPTPLPRQGSLLNVRCHSCGTVITHAFYPTQIPSHYASAVGGSSIGTSGASGSGGGGGIGGTDGGMDVGTFANERSGMRSGGTRCSYGGIGTDGVVCTGQGLDVACLDVCVGALLPECGSQKNRPP